MKYVLLLALMMMSLVHAQEERRSPLHSHNDYQQVLILQDALNNNFESIEVDVWLAFGKVEVAHYPWGLKGSIERLYLKPLQKMVNEKTLRGSVDDPLLLWIDLKSFHMKMIDKLAKILMKYPMIGKEVKVIITGRKRLKRKILEKYPNLPIERDENSLAGDPEGKTPFTWYTLKWSDHTKWKADRPITEAERAELKTVVDQVHSEGRKLRFFATPSNDLYWKVMGELGVDLIDTDKISKLEQFWESFKPQRARLFDQTEDLDP